MTNKLFTLSCALMIFIASSAYAHEYRCNFNVTIFESFQDIRVDSHAKGSGQIVSGEGTFSFESKVDSSKRGIPREAYEPLENFKADLSLEEASNELLLSAIFTTDHRGLKGFTRKTGMATKAPVGSKDIFVSSSTGSDSMVVHCKLI